ncbi:MAG: endonuclease MutS2 [Halothermotrichaceae bacterium]
MKQDIQNILELEKIKNEVKERAATIVAKEVIAGIKPVTDIDYVTECLAEVTAAKKLLKEYGEPPFGGIRDLRKILKKVDKAVVISAKELMDILNTLESFKSLVRYFKKIFNNIDPRTIENYFSLVTNKGKQIETLPKLERELKKCLDEYGEIKDNASSKLASLRKKIERIGNKIRDKMDSIVKSNRYQSMLQDNLITKRGDRFVVPVKSEYKNTFNGIVHDQSASGMTLFMEPLAIVKLNNKLRELKRKEEEEVYRILQELTGKVQQNIVKIKNNIKAVTTLDVIFAKAEYSRLVNGVATEINQNGIVKIKEGRHPLLKEEAVPINIEVGDGFSSLVITGPNTGGKTVALKTLGLFILMTECGLHIPADLGTEISIFQQVYADIGDEQSIEQNLSTFSSHITRIKKFLKYADSDSLVLMDELGAGTDPKEGAALGISILERLRKNGVTTVVTTHYSQLKSYAYNQNGVENASVEFDIKTLQPTYKLLMGIPGGSNAFAIAKRLGIPADIVDDAHKLLSGDEIEIENIISGLNSERKKYKDLISNYENKKEKAEEVEKKYKSLLKGLKAEKSKIIKEAKEEARKIIKNARKQSKKAIKELKNKKIESRPEVDRLGNEINQNLKNAETQFEENEIQEDTNNSQDINIGDQVRLKSVGRKGKVVDINENKKEATVQAGVITITAGFKDLVRVEMPNNSREKMVRKYRVNKSEKASGKLDIRGERYENAQHILDKYLDDVFLAGLKQVEIVHGKGTGALREAVTEALASNPHVSTYRLGRPEEGGSGVTIVDIK